MDSPVWRIAAATGEALSSVEAALQRLTDLGYDADDIWILVRNALNAGMAMTELAATLGPKA